LQTLVFGFAVEFSVEFIEFVELVGVFEVIFLFFVIVVGPVQLDWVGGDDFEDCAAVRATDLLADAGATFQFNDFVTFNAMCGRHASWFLIIKQVPAEAGPTYGPVRIQVAGRDTRPLR
jgi:hypothetical protein